MKTSRLFKNAAILLIFIALTRPYALGQESYIKNRWNFKAGYARYKTGRMIGDKVKTTSNCRIEANCGFLNSLETGIYLGGSIYELLNYYPADSSVTFKNYFTPFYGINVNFHLLPFIIKQNDFRFDLYLTGKFGGLYFSVPKNSPLHGHNNEYAIGTGLCFYLWDHMGLYVEYCFGNFIFEDAYSNDHTKFRYGLTFKFK